MTTANNFNLNCLNKVNSIEDLNKLKPLFKDIRFYMSNSVLDKKMGKAYTNDLTNPTFVILLVRNYCFISGELSKEFLKSLIDNDLKTKQIIPSDNLKQNIEEIYGDEILKKERYSLNKHPKFDLEQLNFYSKNILSKYKIIKIDNNLAKQIKNEEFINITDNYEQDGIGYCCIYDGKIIGVASSNIIYNDGIEVNVKIKEEYRRQGIATTLASNLILTCIKENKKVSWDAANINSLHLAEKLGFKYDSSYLIYYFNEKQSYEKIGVNL